jgi:hypothetical protein
MNNIISYSIITILTLISIICLVNINVIEQKVNIKGTKILIFFIILMTYTTLVSYPVKKIFDNYVLSIKLPKGNKGSRGNRGKSGNSAICDTCGDDLCLKKILFNITNTYNYWRQLNGLKIYPDTYVIKNEYIKDKIIKHCKSNEFQKIIKKYGSNNKNCPDNLSESGCGAYDYMFKMWSIWILIILKYKNGMFFLESDSLTDADFDGLIEAEDCYLPDDIVIYNNDKYIIDKSKESKRIHPMYHIYQKTNHSNKSIVHLSQLSLCTENNSEDESLKLNTNEKNVGANPYRLWNQMFCNKDSEGNCNPETVAGLKIKRIKRNINNSDSITFSALGINEDFIKSTGLPGRGKLSPFDEIKKYDAWYWGREEKLKPELIVTKPYVSEFKKTCPNGKIKILPTNNYYELFSTKHKKYNRQIISNSITIDEIMGNFQNDGNNSNDLIFLRPSKIVMPNEHGYFKEYKPIGDVLITENEKVTGTDGSSGCLPIIDIDYTNVIKKKITDKKTYLVSGDTKSPVDFELVWYYKKTHGINKGIHGLSIWKPIPPQGYRALGYVVDNRYYDWDGDELSVSEDIEDIPKPSLDSIACVPNIITTIVGDPQLSNNSEFTEINSDFFDKPTSYSAQKYDISETKRFFRNKQTNTFASYNDINTDTGIGFNIKINKASSYKCNGSIEPICNASDESSCNPQKCVWYSTNGNGRCKIKQIIPKNNRTSIKDKKYSILKLYE